MSSVWRSETVCRDKNVRKCSLSFNESIDRTVERRKAKIANMKIKTNINQEKVSS